MDNWKAIVFGTTNCKMCKDQISFLKNTFKEKNWDFVDLLDEDKSKSSEKFELAEKLGVEYYPSTVLLNSKNEKILLKKGKIGCDEIVYNLKSKKVLPVFCGDIDFCLLSFNPKIDNGKKIISIDKNFNKISNIEIESVKKIKNNREDYIKKYIFEEYYRMGGKDDWAYLVRYKEI